MIQAIYLGVGLNLTRANNVISLDLGWSQAIEAQSFDRVHRLGQTRPVAVQRLVIADTVEDRVLTMQERKVHGPASPTVSKPNCYLFSKPSPTEVWVKGPERRSAVSNVLYFLFSHLNHISSSELSVKELAALFGLDHRGRLLTN